MTLNINVKLQCDIADDLNPRDCKKKEAFF